MNNIFIIGNSGIGKTTLSKFLEYNLIGYKHVEAGEYFRNNFKNENNLSGDEFVKAISKFSCKILEKDKFFNVKYLKNKYNFSKGKIILSGIRNIDDIMSLISTNDIVVFLNRTNEKLLGMNKNIDLIYFELNKLKTLNIFTYTFSRYVIKEKVLEDILCLIIKDDKNVCS